MATPMRRAVITIASCFSPTAALALRDGIE